MIDIGGDRYLMMGHLRQGSIKVNVGERVSEGQQIARVGNSGHTKRAPHPHSGADVADRDRGHSDDRLTADAENPAHLSAALPRCEPQPGRRRNVAVGC